MKVSRRGRTITIRFDNSTPEGRAEADLVMGAIRRGMIERGEIPPDSDAPKLTHVCTNPRCGAFGRPATIGLCTTCGALCRGRHNFEPGGDE